MRSHLHGLLLILCACSTPKLYPRQPLFEQRLAPRPGYKGLTNQVCEEKSKDDTCTKWSVIVYDLADPLVRKQLRDLKFICNVAGQRFRIDGARNGLTSWTDCGFWCKYQEVDFIDMEKDMQRLINSNTVCAAQESTFGRFLFLK